MDDEEWLAERFEEHRRHLRAVALRMLGSASEADDAVQEAWIRLSRADASAVDNLGGWLTTVVARVSLDMLRSRQARREDSRDADALVALLHPDVLLRADRTAVRIGSSPTTAGATKVAATFSGRALGATAALIDGRAGIMWAVHGRPKVVWDFVLGDDGVVVAIDMIADPHHLARLELSALP